MATVTLTPLPATATATATSMTGSPKAALPSGGAGLVPIARRERLAGAPAGPGAYAAAVLGDGPEAYWKLDEASGTTANDATGHGHTGTIAGGVTLGAPGALVGDPDTAMHFDGSTGKITVANLTGLPSGASPYTIEAWVNFTGSGNQGMAGWGNYGTALQMNVLRTESNYGIRNYWGNNDLWVATPINPWSGAWHYVVASYDGTTRRIYYDGMWINQDTPAAPNVQLTNFTLGVSNSTEWLAGTLDDVAIYTRALSQDQIWTHYQAGTGASPTGTPNLTVSLNATSVHAGQGITLTVTAQRGGVIDPTYTGTVFFRAPDPVFQVNGSSGPYSQYKFTTGTGGDNGTHQFTLAYNTVTTGSGDALTVADLAFGELSATTAAVTVAETTYTVTWSTGTIPANGNVTLTLAAVDSQGQPVNGYVGSVHGVVNSLHGVYLFDYYATWPGGAGNTVALTFSMNHTGTQSSIVTDTTTPTRQGTSAPITVTEAPIAGSSTHFAAPTGIKLADGSILEAFLGYLGTLYVRKNVHTVDDPVWGPLVTVRGLTAASMGADTPSLVRLGGTLGLFHSYPDANNYLQVWLTTSTDNGATWTAPVQLTNDTGNVYRIQALTVGGTVYLFWSRSNADGTLYQETTTDLTTFSAKTAAGQAVGIPLNSDSPNFGITKLSSGTWALGWLWVGDTNFPRVRIATSPDLQSWSAGVDLNPDPVGERWPSSVSLLQDPGSGLLYAFYDMYAYPWDTYGYYKTSGDGGATWSASKVEVIYDRSRPGDGWQGFHSVWSSLIRDGGAGFVAATASTWTGGGGVTPWYGQGGDLIHGMGPAIVTNVLETGGPMPVIPLTSQALGAWSPTECNCMTGKPVNVKTGMESGGATDLVIGARGLPLVVSRGYASLDAVAGQPGPFGYGWHWSYDVHAQTLADGSVAIVEPSGKRSLFWKRGSTWTADANVNATLTASGGGGYVLTRHEQTVWTFDGTGKLTSLADQFGNTQALSYTGSNLSSVAAPLGRSLTITTDGNGHITQIAGSGGLGSSYTYDGSGNLATATDGSGGVTHYTYDGQHQLLTVVDPNNHTAETNTYGSLNRVTQQTDSAGKVTAFNPTDQTSGGSTNGTNNTTDPNGNVIKLTNDGQLRLTQRDVLKPDGTLMSRTLYSYDSNNNLTSITDGNGMVTMMTYDGSGNMLTRTVDPPGLNLQWTYTYNSRNQVLTVKDPNNHTTSSTYDGSGNLLTRAIDPTGLNLKWSYTYNSFGQRLTATDPNTHTTTYAYDTSGQLQTVTSPAPDNAVTTYTYDGTGRLLTVKDANTHTTTYTYDGLGRVKTVTNALNQTTTTRYDAEGNLTSVTRSEARPRTKD
jgi:YD repeat-containing protein